LLAKNTQNLAEKSELYKYRQWLFGFRNYRLQFVYEL